MGTQQKTGEKSMSEAHLDEFEHYNYDPDQDKAMLSGHSGKQRSKKEAEQNTNRHNPGGHERKIVNKLMNAEKNNLTRPDQACQVKHLCYVSVCSFLYEINLLI